METINEILLQRTIAIHPRAKIDNIKRKIESVLSSEDNREIRSQYIDNEKIRETIDEKQMGNIISFFMEDIELMFLEERDNFNIYHPKVDNVDKETGERLFPQKGQDGKVTGTKLENLSTNEPTIVVVANEETRIRATELLLKHPLVLEENDAMKALNIVEKHYDLPFFEKEAYKLRILRKIENDPRDYFTEQKVKYSPMTTGFGILTILFSESEILSLQRKAAIRIRTIWKSKMIKILQKPYNNIINNGLNNA